MARIDIIPVGNLGNRMLQLMLVESLQRRLPQLVLGGVELPEWGIERPRLLDAKGPALRLIGQHVDVPWLARLISMGLVRDFEFAALGFRMAHYLPRNEYESLFPRRQAPDIPRLADSLLINVRGAEILKDTHADYGPLPIDFYRGLIADTGLPAIFMGQLSDDAYSAALRRAFSDARFIPSQGADADFEILRSARHLVVSVSTFSWLGAWLSEAQTIHLPLCGILNPLQRPDIDLTALGDTRYRHYAFPERRWKGTEQQFRQLHEPFQLERLDSASVQRLLSDAEGRLAPHARRYRASLATKAALFATFRMQSRVRLQVEY